MKGSNARNDFYPGMKISLLGEFGVVTSTFVEYYTQHTDEPLRYYGLIRWDTEKESDYEDWTGLFGTFCDLGGHEVPADYVFQFINNDGTFKYKTN